jgi:hypothetical protein
MSTLKVDTVQSTGGATIFTHSGGLFKPNSLICQVSATNTDQSISATTDTLVQWGAVDIDTGSYWDSTNHRYTPSVAGWYRIGGQVRAALATNVNSFFSMLIRKNGSQIHDTRYQFSSDTLSNSTLPIGTLFVELNGSGDYIDMYVRTDEATVIHDSAAPYVSTFNFELVHAT